MRDLEPNILDITGFAPAERYPLVRRWFDLLVVGERLWIVTDRYPGHIRRRLRRDRPAACQWNAARQDKKFWIVVLTKLHDPPPPASPRRTYWERMTAPLLDRPLRAPVHVAPQPDPSRPRSTGSVL